MKSQFQEKHLILSIAKFPSPVLSRNAIMLQHFKSNFHSIICQGVAYRTLKTKDHFKLLVLKVVAVAYERGRLQEVPNIVI